MNIKMPDGTVVAFPDDMPKAQIQSLIRSKFPDAVPPARSGMLDVAQGGAQATAGAAAAAPGPSGFDSLASGARDALTLGFGDEIAAGVRTGGGMWGDYGKDLDQTRAAMEKERSANPAWYLGGQVAGSVPMMAVPGMNLAKGASLGANMARGALGGAAVGGLYGAGSADGSATDRAVGAGMGALTGAGVGAAAPAIGKAVGSVVGKRAGAAAVPTRDATRTEADAFYDLVDKSGLQIDPLSVQAGVQRVKAKVTQALGYSLDNAPPEIKRAIAGLEELANDPVNLRRLDDVKQSLRDAYTSTSAKEKRLATIMAKEFDGYINSLSATDVIGGGSPTSAVQALRYAQGLWATQSKSGVIEDAMRNAELTGKRSDVAGAYEQALKNEFTNLAKDKEFMASLAPAERKAVEKAASGGGWPAWTLRQMGRFSPRRAMGQWTLGGTALSGNLPLAVGLGGVTEAARQGGAFAGRKAASSADTLVRNKGQIPFDPAKAQRAEALANALLGVGSRASIPELLDIERLGLLSR